MNSLVVIAISYLLMPGAGVRSGAEQSLISRGRQAKSLDVPAGTRIPGMKNMTFPPSNPTPGSRTANEMRMQGDARAMMDKMELPNEKVEGQLSPSPSSIILELRIPTSLQIIQASNNGPLSAFLDKVQNELCKVGKLSAQRLQLLGIRGEYTRVPVNASGTSVLEEAFPTAGMVMADHGSMPLGYGTLSSHYHHTQFETMTDQHVIVELEILSGAGNLDATPESIFALWKAELLTSGSSLLRGPLGQVLRGASIERPPVSMSTKHEFKNAFKKEKSSSVACTSWSIHFALACFAWSTF